MLNGGIVGILRCFHFRYSCRRPDRQERQAGATLGSPHPPLGNSVRGGSQVKLLSATSPLVQLYESSYLKSRSSINIPIVEACGGAAAKVAQRG